MSEIKNISQVQKEIKYLEEPLTVEEMKERFEEDSKYVSGVVQISFADVISFDFESLLDLMAEKLTGSLLVQDINYSVVGALNDGDTILINVSGDVSDVVKDFEDEN